MKADGGMLVQPSDDGSRPGYRGKKDVDKINKIKNYINNQGDKIDAFEFKKFAKEVGLMKSDLNTLLQSCDYVSIHVPLLDSTHHLLDAEKMSTMKNTAKIINTSRGGVVDEEALYDAIKNGTLGGAALDVFEKEPAIGNKLAELDNVILTPHIGSYAKEGKLKMEVDAVMNLVNALK